MNDSNRVIIDPHTDDHPEFALLWGAVSIIFWLITLAIFLFV